MVYLWTPSEQASIAFSRRSREVRIRDLNLLLGEMPRGVTVGFLPFGVTDIRLGSTFDADTGCARPGVQAARLQRVPELCDGPAAGCIPSCPFDGDAQFVSTDQLRIERDTCGLGLLP